MNKSKMRANLRAFSSAVVCLCFASSVLANIPGLAPKSPYSFDGYVAYLGSYVDSEQQGNVFDNQLQNRLNFEYRITDGIKFNTSLRNRVFMGDAYENDIYRDNFTTDAGYFNLSHDWLNNENVVATSQFDRLYVTLKGDDIKARIGRYRVNWGMNTIWTPNDLFNPASIYNVDYPEKAGVDALELTYKLGFASEANIVYAPHEQSELDSYAARYLFNTNGVDAQIILGKSYTDWSIGGGFASDVNGIGFKGEATFFIPTESEWSIGSDNVLELENTLVTSLEAMYSFGTKHNLMSNAAVMYISDPIDMSQGINIPLTARTLSYAEWTTYFDLGFDLTALSRMTFMSSYYSDGSYFVGANTTYSLSDDWSLNGFAQYFAQDEGDLVNLSAQLSWYF